MGIICPCGVVVDAFKKNHKVKFASRCSLVEGNLTYLADICTSTLEMSTLSLTFEDKKTIGGLYSFVFTANSFCSVTCKKEGKSCVVTVKGTGLIGKKQYSFEAVFRDVCIPGIPDVVEKFVIKSFFHQNGSVPVQAGSITARGCQS